MNLASRRYRRYHRYPLDHYLYDAEGRLIHETTTWTWGQIPELPYAVEMLATAIETRDALGIVVRRTDIRPVVAS